MENTYVHAIEIVFDVCSDVHLFGQLTYDNAQHLVADDITKKGKQSNQ